MSGITRDPERPIIDDFAQEIERRKRQTSKPTTAVIDFRGERKSNSERPIFVVPTSLLRYRKDNGRIASDVLSFEKNHYPLSETDEDDQKTLGDFLRNKDLEKTKDLINSLRQDGQREPAIITCDGFLINGNRRKLAFGMLQTEFPGDNSYLDMKVVILPGKDNPGGPPTIKEIEQIENRYQLQSDGKAEYYNFDRALSIRRKINSGITLDEQLRDDPNYSSLSSSEFKKTMKQFQKEYLGPLECVDNYLSSLDRDGLYDTVSKGRDDPEGRWQAFIDYHNNVYEKLRDEKKRLELGIDEDEIGKIEDVAFKIIRKREIPGLGKVHMLMRALPKWLTSPDAKKEILKISDISNNLPSGDIVDKDGNELEPRVIDRLWSAKNEAELSKHVHAAKNNFDESHISETPLTLLEAALKKLNHDQMELKSIHSEDIHKTKQLISSIRDRIKEIEHEFYEVEKLLKKDL